MNKSSVLLIFVLFGFIACTGFDTDRVSGDLSTETRGISVKTEAGPVELQEGEFDLHFNTGLIGVYSPSITILQNGTELAEIEIPRKSFNNSRVFVSAQEINQDFGLDARLTNSVIKTWTVREESASCEYYGYCYGCTLTTDAEGNVTNDCGYSNRHDCDGTRWEEREYTTYAQQLDIRFLGLDSKEVGRFKGTAGNVRQTHKLLDHGSCY